MKTLTVIIFFLLVSCSTRSIKLDIVRQTSQILNCGIIYGYNADRLYKENEILIQIGTIDTTDEHPPIETAIINVNKKEIILNLITDSILEKKEIQYFSGENYNLRIESFYETQNFLNGNCTVSTGNLTTTYNLQGIQNPNL